MTIESDLLKSMNEEAEAAAAYRGRAASARADGDEISARLWEHIAEEEDGHYNEFNAQYLYRRINPINGWVRYYWTAFHKGSGEIAENATPHRNIEKALKDAKHFVRSSWRFPGEVLIEAWDKPNKYSGNLPIQSLGEEYLHIPDKYITSEELERSGVMVTVTDAGDTPFRVGAEVPAELFDRENKYRKEAGKRPALGEYHY